MRIGSKSVCIVALAVAVMAAGCGSSTSTSVLAPSPVSGRCGATVSVSPPSVAAEGAAGKISIATERECQWTISGLSSWLQLTAVSGQGPAEITYTVSANRSTSPRTLQLTVLEQPLVITQAAAVCSYRVSPAELSVAAAGDAAKITVSTEDFCSWTVKSLASWIAVASPDSGQGNGEIEVQISRNTKERRSGSVELAGKTVVVTQREAPPQVQPPAPAPPVPPPPTPAPSVPEPSPAPEPTPPAPCTFDVAPVTFADVPAAGSMLAVDVATRSDCSWTTASQAAWLTLDGSSSRTGGGRVQVNVLQNTGTSRSGSVTVAGRTITVAQRGFPESCTYSLDPTSLSLSDQGQRATISVTTQTPCPVSASSEVGWIKIKSQPKTGSGKIEIEVDRNGKDRIRTGGVTVTGHNFSQTVAVTQAADDDD